MTLVQGIRLKRRVLFSLVGAFLLLDFSYLSLNFYITYRLQKGAIAINLSGRQRMLTQRMTKSAHIIFDVTKEENRDILSNRALADFYWRQFQESFEMFDTTLRAFQTGGESIGGDGIPVTLVPVNSKAQALIENTLNDWEAIAEQIKPQLGRSTEITEQRYRILLNTNEELLEDMNTLTSVLEASERRSSTRLRIIQTIAFGFSLGVFGVVLKTILFQYNNIQLQNSQYQSILEGVKSPIFVLDKNEHISWVNHEALHFLKCQPKDILGVSINDLLTPFDSVWRGHKKNQDEFFVEVLPGICKFNSAFVKLITLKDITDHFIIKERLKNQALSDALTGLPNLRLFNDRLTQLIKRTDRLHHYLGYAILDLNGFKKINDIYGHDTGDYVLQVVGERVSQYIRKEETFARLGGDEFGLLLGPSQTKMGFVGAVIRLTQPILEPIQIKDEFVQIGISIGLSIYPDTIQQLTELKTETDRLMYMAKQECHTDVGIAAICTTLQESALIVGWSVPISSENDSTAT